MVLQRKARTLLDLGGDPESLEERRLRGVQGGGPGRDVHVTLRHRVGTRRSGLPELLHLVLDLLQALRCFRSRLDVNSSSEQHS